MIGFLIPRIFEWRTMPRIAAAPFSDDAMTLARESPLTLPAAQRLLDRCDGRLDAARTAVRLAWAQAGSPDDFAPGKLVEMSAGYAAPTFGRGPAADRPPGPLPRRPKDWRPEFKLPARTAFRGQRHDTVVLDEASHSPSLFVLAH